MMIYGRLGDLREIKFRAWYEHDGAMTTVDQIRFDYGDAWIKYSYGYRKLVDLRELKLREYTGLKDKNGKEGYHKDLWLYLGVIYTVEWDDYDAEFYLKHPSSSASDDDHIKMMGFGLGEIIGNVHEHPHLLKGDEANAQTT